MVKILLNSGKTISVLESEVALLVSKGLVQIEPKEKAIKPDYENKMVEKAHKNKKKNAKS